MPRQVLLATLGSLGDLHPFIAIALRLREHGYEPVIATTPEYRDNISMEGIAFHPVGPTGEKILSDLRMNTGELGRKISQDPLFVLEGVAFPYLKSTYDDLSAVIDRSSLVLSSSLMFVARFAAERRAIPHLTVALQPMVFASAYDPPSVPGMPLLAPLLSKLGPKAANAVHGVIKRLVTRRARPLYEFRRSLGLPETNSSLLFEGQFSPHGTLALYSRLLGSVQPDYPPNTTVTGFTFYDRTIDRRTALPSDLSNFLSIGPPPLVFTLGSFAVDFAGDFYRVSREAARRLKKRAVLLVGAQQVASYGGEPADADVCVADYARFSELFPHAAAIIHHGGIGTTGQALRAGKPQLVTPILIDQFDNAARVVRLGVGRSLRLRRYRLDRVESELSALLGDPRYAMRAATIGDQVRQEDGADSAARIVDGVLLGPTSATTG
jgi:rhamnosyltransferase subunit B